MTDKKEEKIVFNGTIIKSLPGTNFVVELDNKMIITSHLSGKMRLHYIKIIPGDRVSVEISQYDLTKGRIIKRL
ncbi:MAG: translation initiation factor IF-1 [Candidatus Omnitrophica bacterium]|jgi:translation initiation factor IF-1|nr:translation initiation factor IF-1 [Candidatus Omnitrophota bacterium]